MPSFTSIHQPLFYIVCFFVFSSLSQRESATSPRTTIVGKFCGTSPPPPNSPDFDTNFHKDMEILAELIQSQKWGSYALGLKPRVYSLGHCMDDLDTIDCLLCFAEARTQIPSCLPANSGRVYLDGCFLRYDNYSFFREPVDAKYDKVVCNEPEMEISDYLGIEFSEKVNQVLKNVTDIAVSNAGFAVTDVKGGIMSMYALAQCWKTLEDKECQQCLEEAGDELRKCLPRKEGRALNAGCYLRYSTRKFYNAKASLENEFMYKVWFVIVIVLAALAFSMLSLFGVFVGYTRVSQMRKERNMIRLSSTIDKSDLNFKYDILEKATNSFDPSRKLGQGAAGSVFKGTLTDGKVVAVKRLFFSTRQWVDEFFNEVNLISGIQHKNLIKLLGCSIEGPESLLIYEYLPNGSLDLMLFDRNKTQILSWKQRFDIVIGTAEGLAHLHGGTATRIIHRDIKCSNILLDENLTAKIGDFGLVRRFAADKTHVSTGIAGTLGYMAPEYLIRGQLTEKADIYSFGVLVIEIVCGRKNNVFMQESSSILHAVWQHYQSGLLPESVDSCLKKDFPASEASNVLQVALLCTQSSAALRPSMSEVVEMLTNKDCTIPTPQQPPFLNSTVIDKDLSKNSSQRLASNGVLDTFNKSSSLSNSGENGSPER